jgi:hypothetical protein
MAIRQIVDTPPEVPLTPLEAAEDWLSKCERGCLDAEQAAAAKTCELQARSAAKAKAVEAVARATSVFEAHPDDRGLADARRRALDDLEEREQLEKTALKEQASAIASVASKKAVRDEARRDRDREAAVEGAALDELEASLAGPARQFVSALLQARSALVELVATLGASNARAAEARALGASLPDCDPMHAIVALVDACDGSLVLNAGEWDGDKQLRGLLDTARPEALRPDERFVAVAEVVLRILARPCSALEDHACARRVALVRQHRSYADALLAQLAIDRAADEERRARAARAPQTPPDPGPRAWEQLGGPPSRLRRAP